MFDLDKFVQSLEKNKEPLSRFRRGVYLVLDYVFRHADTSEIDFDAFTIKDVEIALEQANFFPFDEEGGIDYGVPNALFDYDRHCKMMAALHGIKRKYVADDDFI